MVYVLLNIYFYCWSGSAPPQGERDRKPTTAELEPQGTSVCTCSECRRARPEQCNMIQLPNIAVGLPSACFEILLKYVMLYIDVIRTSFKPEMNKI